LVARLPKEIITATFSAGGTLWIQGSAAAAGQPIDSLMLSAKAVSVNVAEQVTLMALGQQKQFDFIQASTAFLGAAVDAKLGKITEKGNPLAGKLLHTTTSSLLNGAIRGNMSMENLAAQLLSSTIMHAATPAIMHGLEWVDHNVFKTPQPASPVQQQVKTGAKRAANASKDNIYNSERKHQNPAMHPYDFMEKMGIGDLMEDYHKAKAGLVFGPPRPQPREHQKSYITPINDSHGVRQLKTNAPMPKSGFWDYIDGFNQGVEDGRDFVVHMFRHPIDTISGIAVTSFDGYNAITDSVFGISTQGSRLRNVQRSRAIDDSIDRFVEGSGATRLKMVTTGLTTTVLSANVGVVGTTAKMSLIETSSSLIAKSRELFGLFKPKQVVVNNTLKEEIAALNRIGVNAKTYNKTLHQTINLKGAVVDEFISRSAGLSNNMIKELVGPVNICSE